MHRGFYRLCMPRYRARRETCDARICICVQYWKPKSDAPSDFFTGSVSIPRQSQGL
jgi:hypothetical protein